MIAILVTEGSKKYCKEKSKAHQIWLQSSSIFEFAIIFGPYRNELQSYMVRFGFLITIIFRLQKPILQSYIILIIKIILIIIVPSQYKRIWKQAFASRPAGPSKAWRETRFALTNDDERIKVLGFIFNSGFNFFIDFNFTICRIGQNHGLLNREKLSLRLQWPRRFMIIHPRADSTDSRVNWIFILTIATVLPLFPTCSSNSI